MGVMVIRSAKPQSFEGGGFRFAVEDWVDVLDDVGANLQKTPLVLNGNQRPLGAIVARDL